MSNYRLGTPTIIDSLVATGTSSFVSVNANNLALNSISSSIINASAVNNTGIIIQREGSRSFRTSGLGESLGQLFGDNNNTLLQLNDAAGAALAHGNERFTASSASGLIFKTNNIERARFDYSSFRPSSDATFKNGNTGARWSETWTQNLIVDTITLDGYSINLSGSVYDGYSLTYSLNSNKFSQTSSVIYWDGYTTWAQVYNRLLNSINEYDTTPVVIVDGSYTQEIPAGTYDGAAFSNAYFFTTGQARIVIDPSVTFTGGNFTMWAQNIQFNVTGSIVTSGTFVTLLFSGYSGIYNAHASNPVFPQAPDGSHLGITGGSLDSRPSADDMAIFGTAGGVIFDMASAAQLSIDILSSPGGLIGTTPAAIIGGAGTVTIHGDGISIATINSSILTGTTTFASGNPKAYATVLSHFTTGGLPTPTNLPDGYMVLDTTVPAIAVAIGGVWKKTTLS